MFSWVFGFHARGPPLRAPGTWDKEPHLFLCSAPGRAGFDGQEVVFLLLCVFLFFFFLFRSCDIVFLDVFAVLFSSFIL